MAGSLRKRGRDSWQLLIYRRIDEKCERYSKRSTGYDALRKYRVPTTLGA